MIVKIVTDSASSIDRATSKKRWYRMHEARWDLLNASACFTPSNTSIRAAESEELRR